MSNCELLLSSIGIGVGTYFWLWYLIYEASVAKGIRKRTRWWERDIFKVKRDD
jgi:hypothetical protein